jgi:hypothetical protein
MPKPKLVEEWEESLATVSHFAHSAATLVLTWWEILPVSSLELCL